MGSKAKYASDIFFAIADKVNLTEYYSWVEPFVGGANMMSQVVKITEHDRRELGITFVNKIGNDINPFLIRMFQAVQKGWKPNENYDETVYKLARENAKMCFNPTLNEAAEIGFIGIGCSYAGKWFGGYARGNANNGSARNYARESRDNLLKQGEYLQNVFFCDGEYQDFNFPVNSIVYCDPPYQGVTEYKNTFDHGKFWQWCKEKSQQGHKVFVSEYSAPPEWTCIWERTVNNSLTKDTGSKQGVERLFTIL